MAKTQTFNGEIVTPTAKALQKVEASALSNDDLRPVTPQERTWTGYNMATLWIGMAVCIPTYQLGSGLIAAGMNWWEAVMTVMLGNLIVLIPLILNAHAGTRYGIPYPVFARLWFGTKGAHVPAVLRGLVAAGWFGIQTWIGGAALDTLLASLAPAWKDVPLHLPVAFLFFWGLNVFIAYRGPESIKRLEAYGAPILLVMGVLLLIWAFTAAGGAGPILSQPSKFHSTGEFLTVFFPSLTAMIGFWATLALNIPDFARYVRKQKQQAWGQIVGLPATMGLYSFIGVAVTSATVVIFGKAIWDPVELMSKFPPIVVIVGTFGIVLATITTNIAANVVAPARAVSNLFPRRFTFAHGAIVTGLVGIAMFPWAILANYGNYIFNWLGIYSALLGPIDGIALADYWLVRHGLLDVAALYDENGRYRYTGGINLNAIYALAIGILAALIGKVVPALSFLFANAWAVGLLVSLVVYTLLMQRHASVISQKEFDSITERVDEAAPYRVQGSSAAHAK